MTDKTLGLIVKLVLLLLFLVALAVISVLLEHATLNVAGIDISAGIHFFAGFSFCQFYNYIFNN